MPLDPNVKAILDEMAAQGGPAFHEVSPEASREMYRELQLSGEPEPVEAVADRTIPGPGGDIPVRVYTPKGDPPLPVLVFFHGGGFVIGDLETHDGECRALTNAAGCIVVAVDYRLAPEHKFPAAVDDAFVATEWVAANAASIGADANRVAVGGDSAGGNLAAVVAQMAKDRGGPQLALQLLIYPATDYGFDTVSHTENADGYLLTKDMMEWFQDQYLPSEEDGADPRLSPLRADDLSGLPPALVITAEFDPLRDEGEAYAARLADAGVPANGTRYDGMIHGFFPRWPGCCLRHVRPSTSRLRPFVRRSPRLNKRGPRNAGLLRFRL